MGKIADNLDMVRRRVAELAAAAGRHPDSVRIVAVSKNQPVSALLEAYEAGQRLFGENRVQELEEKYPLMPPDVEWHLIGHLQSNKAAKAVAMAAAIHSVDSPKLVERLGRLAADAGRQIEIFLEVNVSGEDSKYGLPPVPDELLAAALAAGEWPSLRIAGLMTMAPFDAAEPELRRIFSFLRELRGQLAAASDIDLPSLSMGMSSDYHAAIAEGATHVRVGGAIFQ